MEPYHANVIWNGGFLPLYIIYPLFTLYLITSYIVFKSLLLFGFERPSYEIRSLSDGVLRLSNRKRKRLLRIVSRKWDVWVARHFAAKVYVHNPLLT